MKATKSARIFSNKNFMFRGVFDQRKTGRFTGSFGFSGFRRDYDTVGAEALAPPTIQNNFAVFGLQEIDFERVRFQLGGRVEHNGYRPDGSLSRSFTGFSGAAGVRVGLWQDGAFVANYTHSYRAPALEELYNNGPHIGNLTFEVGNPLLTRERNDGIDFSLRHDSKRVRGVANFYYYDIKDFVFLAPTGRDRGQPHRGGLRSGRQSLLRDGAEPRPRGAREPVGQPRLRLRQRAAEGDARRRCRASRRCAPASGSTGATRDST